MENVPKSMEIILVDLANVALLVVDPTVLLLLESTEDGVAVVVHNSHHKEEVACHKDLVVAAKEVVHMGLGNGQEDANLDNRDLVAVCSSHNQLGLEDQMTQSLQSLCSSLLEDHCASLELGGHTDSSAGDVHLSVLTVCLPLLPDNTALVKTSVNVGTTTSVEEVLTSSSAVLFFQLFACQPLFIDQAVALGPSVP